MQNRNEWASSALKRHGGIVKLTTSGVQGEVARGWRDARRLAVSRLGSAPGRAVLSHHVFGRRNGLLLAGRVSDTVRSSGGEAGRARGDQGTRLGSRPGMPMRFLLYAASEPNVVFDSIDARMRNHELLSGVVRLHIFHHAADLGTYGQWIMDELVRHGYELSPA